jgi:hypothetical protein
MPNNLGLAGAQPQKQARFAPIFTSRFFSGLVTNRSPLRDATTSRIVEKFYGQAGDALIAGSNVELTTKLTLARRPGLSVYDSHSYTVPDRFYEFKLFNSTTEEILVMIDTANTLYSLFGGVRTTAFTKSSGSGQSYMQSVGNILYFGDGIDNKKWLQTLNTWTASTPLGVGAYPFFSTFIIDSNGNIEQIIGTFVQASSITIASGLLTVGLTSNPIGVILQGDTITFPPTMTATFLENQNLVVTGVTSSALVFNYLNPAHTSYSGSESNITLEDINSGTPVTGTVLPTWSTVIPTYLNNFAGGQTYDNSVIWVNRGPTIENWGIDISKGYQIPQPSTNSPVNPYTMAGGSSSSSQSGYGSDNTSSTLSGFASQVVNNAPVTLSCGLSVNAVAVPVTIMGDELLSGNIVNLQYSIDSGSTWTTFYTQSWLATTSFSNLPTSVQVAGLTNIDTLQVKILTTSFAGGPGGSSTLTATLGVITATIGQVVTQWSASTTYTTGQMVVDSNGNVQTVSTGGTSAAAEPLWAKVLGGLTQDNTVVWTLTQLGSISAFNGGYRYAVALVNTLDNTVSNCTPLSPATGNFIGESYVILPPGDGLPPTQLIDPQADYVAIFRTTDGQSVPFLIPGEGNAPYTLTLTQYLQNGYHDSTNDTGLNNLIEGAIVGENTPPAQGAINLAYHLNCIFYSIGNIVYWTSGPTTPVGNGLNGTNPLNTDSMPSLVKRLVPTSSGMLVFTVSDVYLIQGSNTVSSPIQPALPILPGIGLLSYNALDLNGPIIGLFTTDNQFLLLDPSSGTTYAGLPIGDQLLLDNGTPGQNWNPANVYVAWHVQGMDQGWYVCDGLFGWYKLIQTPSPEGPGWTWAPFATLTGGAGAVQSIEITPGVHRLLVAPAGTGEILFRDLTVWTDNGTAYAANATIGSAVLVQPGQVAEVAFIVTDAVKIGTPISIGVLMDEALPYYTGPIDILTNWTSDPPNLPTSKSFYSQRFYMSELQNTTAACRHMQIQILFSPYDTVQNELLTITVFGAFSQEI